MVLNLRSSHREVAPSLSPPSSQAMYNKIDTNDEGDISMRNVITHIQAVEAGSGQNTWVNNR